MSSIARSSAGDKPPPNDMTKPSPETSILSLPKDLLLNCLARVSRLYYPTLSLVSKKLRAVVASPELYETRSRLNRTESCLYLCLRYHLDQPTPYWLALCRKPNRTLTDGSSGRLFIPVTSPDSRHEKSSTLVAVGSDIYKIGGYKPSSSQVSVFDCRFNTWHSAPMMREKRSCATASVVDGKIYVAGGCEDVNSENWVEVFDPKTQTWGNVTNPSSEICPRAGVYSLGVEGKLYLFGDMLKYVVYDPKEDRWDPMGLGMDMDDVTSAAYFHHGVIGGGDILFIWKDGEFNWFDSKTSSWKKLRGVEDLPDVDVYCRMVDLGGKLAVLWEVCGRCDDEKVEKFIWCAEIALEMRDGDELWGNVEWCDVVLTFNERCGLLFADVLSATV
ncbi:F-box/kelch-repeat protein [Hirschfeldia incana]|nr:F-box/kelch-repeat protein [Hirschfeldia incana]